MSSLLPISTSTHAPRMKLGSHKLIGVILMLCASFLVLLSTLPAHADFSRRDPTASALTALIDQFSSTTSIYPSSSHQLRAVVATTVEWHGDVMWAVANEMKAMGNQVKIVDNCRQPDGARGRCGRGDLLHIMYEAGVWEDPIIETDDIEQVVMSTNTFDGHHSNVVVLPTVEKDLPALHEKLLRAWYDRPINEKFVLVVVAHDASNAWLQEYGQEWSRLGALRILTISEHTKNAVREHLNVLADHKETRNSGFDLVPVEVCAVVMPIQNWLPTPIPKSKDDKITHAIIVGKLEEERRDYITIFEDLSNSLQEDPFAWGYNKPLSEGGPYTVDPTANSAFQLHLLGQSGDLVIPPALEYIVIPHQDVDYRAFYNIMTNMDLMIPAFKEEHGYHTKTASAAVQRSIEARIPLLTTQRTLASYQFFWDSSLAILRPHALSDIEAIRLLREFPQPKDASLFKASDGSHWGMELQIQAMLRSGWQRSIKSWNRLIKGVHQRNVDSLSRLLSDGVAGAHWKSRS